MRVTLYIIGGKVGEDALTELGASCYLLVVEVGGKTYCYLIDAGMESKDDSAVTYAGPRDLHVLQDFEVDEVFLSHAHRDHVAALGLKAVMSRFKPDARIIATRPTTTFLSYVLHDQVKVSDKRSEKRPYGQFEIHQLMKRAHRGVISEPRVFTLVPDVIDVLIWPSAHIRGGCSFIFRIRDGKKIVRIMLSGDYCTHNQLSTVAAPLPPDEWYPDIIASFDCTNGAEDLTSGTGVSEEQFWRYEMGRMADGGHNTVKAGGMAFYWAFALDRTPTFAKELANLGLLVWVDGRSAIELTHRMIAPEGSWCDSDQPLNMGAVRVAEHVFQPLQDEEPCAIVAPGGMGHGPAVEYFKQLLPRENCLVASSGYQAHGTNGWRVGQKKRGETVRLLLDGDEYADIVVAARVEKYRATAHSLRGMAARRIEELLSHSQFLNSGTPILGLCHGATPALDWFERRFSGMKTFRQDRPQDRRIVLVE